MQQVQPNNELSGEPALYAALISSGVQLVAAFFFPLPDVTVAAINAVVLAAAGVYVTLTTRSADQGGSVKAAILGLAQAGLSLAVTLGWEVSPEKTATLMAFIGLLVGVFIRQTSTPRTALARR